MKHRYFRTHSSTVLAATLMCVMLPALSVAADAPKVSGSGRYFATGDSANVPALPADIWSIDIRSTGPQCIVDPNNVRSTKSSGRHFADLDEGSIAWEHVDRKATFP